LELGSRGVTKKHKPVTTVLRRYRQQPGQECSVERIPCRRQSCLTWIVCVTPVTKGAVYVAPKPRMRHLPANQRQVEGEVSRA
jgi:hypothetical protein